MTQLQICKLESSDIPEVRLLIELVIRDSFIQQGVDIVKQQAKLEEQIAFVTSKLDQPQDEDFIFFTARQQSKIVGLMGIGSLTAPVKLALAKLQHSETGVIEIMSAYIHPEFQGQGIGTKLLQTILVHLKHSQYTTFALDTGYLKAKEFWTRRLGNPSVCLDKYWGKADCWVWVREIQKA